MPTQQQVRHRRQVLWGKLSGSGGAEGSERVPSRRRRFPRDYFTPLVKHNWLMMKHYGADVPGSRVQPIHDWPLHLPLTEVGPTRQGNNQSCSPLALARCWLKVSAIALRIRWQPLTVRASSLRGRK